MMKKSINPKRLALHIVLETAVIVLLFFVLFWPFRVSGDSMEPHFRNGGTVAATRLLAWVGLVDRGDVIICRVTQNNVPQRAIKRVIGLPGEHIEIKNGNVYINGNYLPHTHETPGQVYLTLGDNEFFVLGDDREMSYDSRLFGVVRRADIVARVLFSRSY